MKEELENYQDYLKDIDSRKKKLTELQQNIADDGKNTNLAEKYKDVTQEGMARLLEAMDEEDEEENRKFHEGNNNNNIYSISWNGR